MASPPVIFRMAMFGVIWLISFGIFLSRVGSPLYPPLTLTRIIIIFIGLWVASYIFAAEKPDRLAFGVSVVALTTAMFTVMTFIEFPNILVILAVGLGCIVISSIYAGVATIGRLLFKY